jgi:hypothetical protein
MTLEELIRNTEISLDVDKEMINTYRDAAKKDNRELDAADRQFIRTYENKINTAKANLAKFRELKAEEDEQEKRLETITPTGAGQARSDGATRLGDGNMLMSGLTRMAVMPRYSAARHGAIIMLFVITRHVVPSVTGFLSVRMAGSARWSGLFLRRACLALSRLSGKTRLSRRSGIRL